jgi:hypothetical protein
LPYPNAKAACVAQCIDLFNHSSETEPPGSPEEYCNANARVSTNFDENTCYEDACTSGGTLLADFFDPRRYQEPVKWIDLINASAAGNDLTRTSPTNGVFDSGGASAQTIEGGDGWVEFEVTEKDKSHFLGLSKDVGADTDPSEVGIQFGIDLAADGKVWIAEDGVALGDFVGTYEAGDRFRVVVKDNLDGTASITYFRLIGPCAPGTPCNGTTIGSSPTMASYPLRVDAALGYEGATLKNVTLVRIQ